MEARKLWIAALACCCAALAPLASAAAGSHHGRAPDTRVSIHPYPDGLFGYVTSHRSARCASHRRVAVFKQHGRRKHPRRDRRIATARTKRSHGFYQWSAKTSRLGTFYARAKQKPGCRPGLSRSLRLRPGAPGVGDDGGGYPPCTPYLADGNASVCWLPLLSADFRKCGPFGKTYDVCDGFALGQPTWGDTVFGAAPSIKFAWSWQGGGYVKYWAYEPDGTIAAYLEGRVPNSSSGDFTITSGYAKADPGPSTGRLFFYTPNIPGQAAGDPGGPLFLNFHNESGSSHPFVEIKGYLYIARPYGP